MNGIALSGRRRHGVRQAVPVHLGHLDVGEDDVDRVLAEPFDRLESVSRLDDLMAQRAERHRQHRRLSGVVVDDEHGAGVSPLEVSVTSSSLRSSARLAPSNAAVMAATCVAAVDHCSVPSLTLQLAAELGEVGRGRRPQRST